jgi:hypothetical protein
MRDTGIADRLRARGLTVTEVAGWQTRGSSSFNPKGSVNHHTVGSRRGNAPSLNVCTFGRAGLSGPLCNVLQGRDNTIYVIAAGRANHAGRGGWRGLSGNSSVYGLEVENVGTTAEPWRPDQIATMVKVHAALLDGIGGNAANVCQHKEWAPSRKPDAHSIDGDDFRRMVADELAGRAAPRPPSPPDPAVLAEVLRIIDECSKHTFRRDDPKASCVETLQRVLNHKAGQGLVTDGIFGPATEAAVRNVQRIAGMAEDGVATPAVWEVLKQAP